jgi:nucleotide-binding universal stress UspA family protein
MSGIEQRPYRIVVGFDGSEHSRRALIWAVEEARQRGGNLEVVRAWTPGEFGSNEEMGQIAQKNLDSEVAATLGPPLELQVSTVVQQGHAAKVLVEQAQSADMLVVGSRGHGGFTGLLLGSVSHQVATHGRAPVVVIVRA